MTALLDRAIAAARQLPPEAQDEIARELLIFAGEEVGPVPLTPEERAAVAAGRAAAAGRSRAAGSQKASGSSSGLKGRGVCGMAFSRGVKRGRPGRSRGVLRAGEDVSRRVGGRWGTTDRQGSA